MWVTALQQVQENCILSFANRLGFGAVLTPLTPLTLFLLSLFVRRKRRREKNNMQMAVSAVWPTVLRPKSALAASDAGYFIACCTT